MALPPSSTALPLAGDATVYDPPRRRGRWRGDRWGIGVAIFTGVLALPLLAILFYSGQESLEWDHLAETVLGRYLTNTLILVLGVSLLVLGAISRSRVESALIGHTAERLLDDVPCDMLIIKPDGFVDPSRPS